MGDQALTLKDAVDADVISTLDPNTSIYKDARDLFGLKKDTLENQPIPRIDFKGGTKYATNESSDVYLDFEELGGFPYIKTIVIGDINEKVKRVGCSLTFYFEKDSLTIHSDNTDIESNNIKNTPFFYTEIDFELDELITSVILKPCILSTSSYSISGKINCSFTPKV